jgi:hypothetical protein
MEGVEEESHEQVRGHGGLTDDSSSTEIMAPARRRSSVSIDNVMTDARVEEDQAEEMPFAIRQQQWEQQQQQQQQQWLKEEATRRSRQEKEKCTHPSRKRQQ